MTTPPQMVSPTVARVARRWRFPRLLMLIGGLFLLDLLIPDLIPFLDEILLGLTTALLAVWRERANSPPL